MEIKGSVEVMINGQHMTYVREIRYSAAKPLPMSGSFTVEWGKGADEVLLTLGQLQAPRYWVMRSRRRAAAYNRYLRRWYGDAWREARRHPEILVQWIVGRSWQAVRRGVTARFFNQAWALDERWHKDHKRPTAGFYAMVGAGALVQTMAALRRRHGLPT